MERLLLLSSRRRRHRHRVPLRKKTVSLLAEAGDAADAANEKVASTEKKLTNTAAPADPSPEPFLGRPRGLPSRKKVLALGAEGTVPPLDSNTRHVRIPALRQFLLALGHFLILAL